MHVLLRPESDQFTTKTSKTKTPKVSDYASTMVLSATTQVATLAATCLIMTGTPVNLEEKIAEACGPRRCLQSQPPRLSGRDDGRIYPPYPSPTLHHSGLGLRAYPAVSHEPHGIQTALRRGADDFPDRLSHLAATEICVSRLDARRSVQKQDTSSSKYPKAETITPSMCFPRKMKT